MASPGHPLNASSLLEFASRNTRGMVEYVATFTILKPTDMAKASGVLLYFVPNRGRISLTGGGFLADARKRGTSLSPAAGRETSSLPKGGRRCRRRSPGIPMAPPSPGACTPVLSTC